MIAARTGSPNIIGLEYCHSDDACMTLDQSAVSSCLLLLHAKFAFGFGALNNATIRSGVLSVSWQGKAFFCRASSKANLKYWYIKSAQNQHFVQPVFVAVEKSCFM